MVSKSSNNRNGSRSNKAVSKKVQKGGLKSKGETDHFNNMSSFKKWMNQVESQLGGGYSTNPEEMVAGMPVYSSYNDCAPPTILGNKLVKSGCKSQCGGKRKSKKSNKSVRKSHKKNSKNNSKSVRKHSRKASKKHGKKHAKSLKGGMRGKYPFEGKQSVFTDDMKKRTFGCRQPEWNPKCI